MDRNHIVKGFQGLPFYLGNQVLRHNWSLFSSSSNRLGIRCRRNIAQSEHIVISCMLQGSLVDVDPSCCPGQRAILDKVWCTLWGADVDHIEFSLNKLWFFTILCNLELSLLVWAIDLDQVMSKIECDVVFLNIFHQWWHIRSAAK